MLLIMEYLVCFLPMQPDFVVLVHQLHNTPTCHLQHRAYKHEVNTCIHLLSLCSSQAGEEKE